MKTAKLELDRFVGLKEAVKRINDVDCEKLPVILLKIAEKCLSKEEAIFSSDEELKFISGLNLEGRNELESISKLCHLIFQQAIYHLMSTASMKNELACHGFSENSIAAFSGVWSSNRKDLLLKARQLTLAGKRLSSVDWSLSLDLARDSLSSASHVKPNAMFDLGIRENDSRMSTEVISLEFDHKRLYEFYQQLETIQQQLDILTS